MICKTALLLLVFVATTSMALMNRQTYIVHMDKTKIAASHHSLGNSKEWYEAVIDSITDLSAEEEESDSESTSPQLIHVYESAISGFAAKLSSKELESLKKIDGFLSATPDEMFTLQTTRSPQFLGLEYGKGLWNASNLNSDVIIGLVDSGIWPEHVSFQDENMPPVPSRWKGPCEEGTNFTKSNCNKKIIGARYFFKGYEATIGKFSKITDYKSARDSVGHGTHTASTAAGNLVDNASMFGLANGTAGGMGYTSRLAIYKVCWNDGAAAGSDIIAGIDQAIADGVDVLSLSLGSFISKPYNLDEIAISTFQAVKKGIFVSCAGGNSGPSSSSVTNTAPWIMTVAASYLDRKFATTVELGDGQTFQGSSLYVGNETKQLPLVYGETAGGNKNTIFCAEGSLNRERVKGKIVVCDSTLIFSRFEQGEQVKLAGGAGMLLLNDEKQGEERALVAQPLPDSSLGFSESKAIKEYLKSTTNPTASITFKGTEYGKPAPMMAAFSSRGPNAVGPDLIKPDVTAPGVNILAAWPGLTGPSSFKSDERRVLFNIASGTSMSCPHVSGIAALLKSVHNDWSPAAIKSALMTTAYVHDDKCGEIADVASSNYTAATPFAFGSGHVDPEKASDPGLIYDITPEDYLNYLCSLKYSASDIAKFAGKDFTCPQNLTMQPGDLNYPSFAVNFKRSIDNNTVTFTRTVTHVGIPNVTYEVRGTEPDGVSITVEPEILKFENPGQKLSYKITFTQRNGTVPRKTSFGYIKWSCLDKYHVRSPVAVTW
ncbi:PREDICTED: subtilisin-like protease SBT1.1 [Theobroma cacao]|uniref:Subtilisin-like protease SBT1.1 n=1 Tax=Theobroma cacao TaxID=3641 RepID=A0AB32WF46_THECC|nr:PREDICTED: subtilisin-like protease SBT1.1 [Theobroma cacao]